MDRYAVLGNPVGHSLSPRIHARFAAQTGQALSYEALEPPLDGFADFVAELHRQGYRGMNVTIPFKGEAWALAEPRSPRAELARSVNTLIRTAQGWRGDTTDGVGLVRDLTGNLGVTLTGQRLLLVGAGGAARAVTGALLEAGPAVLHVANRTAPKARELARVFAHLGPIRGSGLDGPYDDAPFDVIINATATSLESTVPSLPDGLLRPGGLAYDMMYAAEPTPFVHWGLVQGAARSVDGLGMLVEQAAESFWLWRGVRPETGPVLAALRTELGYRDGE